MSCFNCENQGSKSCLECKNKFCFKCCYDCEEKSLYVNTKYKKIIRSRSCIAYSPTYVCIECYHKYNIPRGTSNYAKSAGISHT